MNKFIRHFSIAVAVVIAMSIMLFVLYCAVILLLLAFESGGMWSGLALTAVYAVIFLTIYGYYEEI